MKTLFIFCALGCFAAFYSWPIGYYTFLRVVVSLGSIVAIYCSFKYKNYFWIATFATILILFNPIFPIYLYRKSIWLPFDIVVGILFLLLTFLMKEESQKKEPEVLAKGKTYNRDIIIQPKNLTKKENE